jgi:hypothetical protein
LHILLFFYFLFLKPSFAASGLQSFSAMRSLALLARGFSAISRSLGTTGLLVRILIAGVRPHRHTGKFGGQTQLSAFSLKNRFTMRSSPEWNVMIASRPPASNRSTA